MYVVTCFKANFQSNVDIMKIRLDDTETEEKSTAKQVIEGVEKQYQSFNDWIAIKEDDNIPIFLVKLIARVLGIGFMIVSSPFILFVLIIAVLVAL